MTIDNVPLSPDNFNDTDTIFVVRQISGKPRLASRSVKPSGTIQYKDTSGQALQDPLNFDNADTPFTEPHTASGEYQVKTGSSLAQNNGSLDESHSYGYTVGSAPERYAVHVRENGRDAATFKWTGGKLKASETVNLDEGKKVVFVRGEGSDVPVQGQIIILATYTHNGGSEPAIPPVHLVINDGHGCWTPENGSYDLKILEPDTSQKSSGPEKDPHNYQFEETGGDEGDLIVNPPPP